jgi:two-component system cell cycle sensor histidine kinase/response regulator CckA
MQTTLNNPSAKLHSPSAALEKNHRILVVDDNEAIHADFRKILEPDAIDEKFAAEQAEVFGTTPTKTPRVNFEIDFAFQGEEALQRVQAAAENQQRYAVVFMDVRMPPGWDGLETTLKLWEVDPDLQVVICTAYSDYSWEAMMKMIASPERLLILKKPFDTIEVLQLAHALTEKWSLLQAARFNTAALECAVEERTQELQGINALLEGEITRHKAAVVERTRAEEQTLKQADLLNLAHDAIMVRDMDGNVTFWNQGAERLYGWTTDEIRGRRGSDFLYADKAAFLKGKEAMIEDGQWSGELQQVKKNGDKLIVSCRWTLVRNERGEAVSYITINNDISEQKKAEEQFLRAQRLESIGTLASGVAHDLNNILLPIMMAAPVLRAEMNPATREKFLDIVESSARRGADIIKQVLTFARGADGNRILLQPIYLLEEVSKIASETFPKSITLRTFYDEDIHSLEADPTQLHQVLLNLCINARDAMPDGGQLCLGAENFNVDDHYANMTPGATAGPHVMLEVADSGSGIPKDVVDKIFDPFFTTKSVGQGTGLGLSTVAGIVKSHGGFIQVTSEPGRTSFKIFLPAKNVVETSSALQPDVMAPHGEGQTILMVDDEASIREVAQLILESNGYKVLVAENGSSALALFAQQRDQIAAVVSDLAMPIMDGLTLVRTLRKIDPELKVIVSTGRSEDFQAAEIAALNIDSCLTKPYTTRNLLLKLSHVLHNGIQDAA